MLCLFKQRHNTLTAAAAHSSSTLFAAAAARSSSSLLAAAVASATTAACAAAAAASFFRIASAAACSVRKESVQNNVIRGTLKVSLTLSGRYPEPTPTKPNDFLGCCSKPRLSNRPQMPPPSRHVGSGESYLFSSLLLNLGFEPVRASLSRGWVRERVTGG